MNRNEAIMDLHRSGMTYGQIADYLSEAFPGLTRNAVAGVVCRLRQDRLPELSVAELSRRSGLYWGKARLVAEFSA